MASPLVGSIMRTQDARAWLERSLGGRVEAVDLCSAYIKFDSLFHIESALQEPKADNIRILARWKLSDLVSGASDMHAYELARKNGWHFFVKQDFHGKVYQIQPFGVLVGSANLTMSGLGLIASGNDEACVVAESSLENSAYVNHLFQHAVEIDSVLYSKIKSFVESCSDQSSNTYNWPQDILDRLHPEVSVDSLLVDEWFFLETPKLLLAEGHAETSIQASHDRSVLGLHSSEKASLVVIRDLFLTSKPYLWFRQAVLGEGGEVYFGRLSELLHDALVDDPRPYRRTVKEMLQNIINWCAELNVSELLIDRPSHSQRIRILKGQLNGS